MCRLHHVIWDWNGTLLDDVGLCVDIVNGMLLRRGCSPIDVAHYRTVFDFPVQTYYERVGFDFSRETFEEAAGEFVQAYATRVCECSLQDGARQLLELFAARGIRQSVLSATEQGQLDEMVTAFGLEHVFDHVVGQADYRAEGKTRTAERLFRSLSVAADETLLLGDTTHDESVAHAAGVNCILVSVGHQCRDKLVGTGAPVVQSLLEIPKLLAR